MTGVEVTGVAQELAWRTRELPPVEQVRPGLWSVPLPNAASGIRYVLCYVFELDDGVALVDPGWDDEDSWRALADGLARIGRRIEDTRLVVVTHVHPDHHGLSERIRRSSGAEVVMHAAEAATLPAVPGRTEDIVARVGPWLVAHGVPAAERAEFRDDVDDLSVYARLHPPDRTVADDDVALPVPGWTVRAIWTPGHTPGHLCLYLPDERLLLTGDHILPRISPNVAAYPGPRADPLGAYLDSLDRLRGLAVDEVLPAHEYRFAGLRARLDALAGHHEQRLEEARATVTGAGRPVTARWVAERLAWSRPWQEISVRMRRAALGEALAHLIALRERGQLVEETAVRSLWTAPATRPGVQVPATTQRPVAAGGATIDSSGGSTRRIVPVSPAAASERR